MSRLGSRPRTVPGVWPFRPVRWGLGPFTFLFVLIMGLGLFNALCPVLLAQSSQEQNTNAQQLFRAAYEAQKRGEATLAVSKYQELLRLYPDMTAARANLGIVFVSLGRFDEAIEQDRTALAQFPDNASLRLNLALAYYKKGDFASAANHLKPLDEAKPGNVQVATLLGQCYVRLGRDAEAISLLTSLEPANLDNLDLKWALGSALIRVGRTEEGLERVETVAERGHSAEAYVVAAQSYLKLGLKDKARPNYDAAIRLDPKLPGLYTLGGMLLEYSFDYDGAIKAYQEALGANPNDFEARLRLGAVLYEQRHLDAAKEQIDLVLETDPASSLARFTLARVERAQGQLVAATNDLEKVAQAEPDWLPPHIELAALYYRLNRPEDGAREKKIVDRLSAEEQQRGTKSHIISPTLPLH